MSFKQGVRLGCLTAAAIGLGFGASAEAADSIARFVVLDKDTQVTRVLGADGVIDLANGKNLCIRAETSPSVVGSVKFEYDSNSSYRIENSAPYTLSGDKSGVCNTITLTLGSHKAKATPYTGSSASGTAGTPLGLTFTVVNSAPTVTGLSLMDMKTGAILASSISVGSTINVPDFSAKCLSVRANVSGTVGSVAFSNGENESFAVESIAPYDLMGDGGSRGCLKAGPNSIEATAYSLANRGGTASPKLARSFTIGTTTSSTAPAEPSAPSSPTSGSSSSGLGRNFYFSSTAGDDSRSVTQAQSESTPWKTIDKLNTYFPNLLPGDSVLFRRGDTFYGSIKIVRSGTSTKPLTIGAYGSGSAPVITGFKALSEWTSLGNGIYEALCSACGTTVSTVTIDGEVVQLGRWPNESAANRGYRTITSHNTMTSVTDSTLTSSPNWAGAELVVRTRRWQLDRFRIKSHSGATLYIEADSGLNEPPDGYGYFIQNHPSTLDEYGEWYYNPSTKKVRVHFGSSSPAGVTVKATSLEKLVDNYNNDYVTVHALHLHGANSIGIDIYSADGSKIRNLTISQVDVGVDASYSVNSVIEDNSISWAHTWGIMHWGSDMLIQRNRISDTGRFGGMSQSGAHSHTGIRSNGPRVKILQNQILRSGYNGIRFTGDYVTIKNNFIQTFALVKDDSGGIYTSITDTVTVGREIVGNIILDGIGSPEGTKAGGRPVNGIYIDDGSNGITITGNTVSRMAKAGIFIHNAYNLNIFGNTLYNNPMHIRLDHDRDTQPTLTGLRVEKNLSVSRTDAQEFLLLTSINNDLANFGTFAGNRYVSPLGHGYGFETVSDSNGISTRHYRDLPGWQAIFGEDAGAVAVRNQWAPYRINSAGANRVSNGTFNSSKSGITPIDGTITWESAGKLDGGYVKVSMPDSAGGEVLVPSGALVAGKHYLVKYSLRGDSDKQMSLSGMLRSSGIVIGESQHRKIGTARTENALFFTASKSVSSSSLGLKITSPGTFYLDNIQIMEVDATLANPENLIRFEYNASMGLKTIALDAVYVDGLGVEHSGSITLDPYESAVLTRKP